MRNAFLYEFVIVALAVAGHILRRFQHFMADFRNSETFTAFWGLHDKRLRLWGQSRRHRPVGREYSF